MQKLIQGIHHFQTQIFESKKALFRGLANGQAPSALFITCSDSRINPNLLTQTEPGEIFILRNAGNLVPAYPAEGGEIATIEFAIKGLMIKDIIICGHSDCGAMRGLLNVDPLKKSMPTLARWLSHAERTSSIILEKYHHLEGEARTMATVEENVIVQLENLRTHPFVDKALREGRVKLHGWVYKIDTGRVFSYEPETGQFIPLQAPEQGVSKRVTGATRARDTEMNAVVC